MTAPANPTPDFTPPPALIELRSVAPEIANILEQSFRQIDERTVTRETERQALIDKINKDLADFTTKRAVENRKRAIYGNEGSLGEFTESERKLYYVNNVGNIMRAFAATKGVQAEAADMIRNTYKDERTAEIVRSMSIGVNVDGGFLVQPDYAPEFIDFLFANAILRQLGVNVLPMPQGQLRIHRKTGAVFGFYEGELANIRTQQPTTDLLTLSAKKLAVIIPISNELLNDSSGRVNQMITTDVATGLTLRMDRAGIRDNGTANQPTGIRFSTVGTNIIGIAAAGITTIPALLEAMQGQLLDQNLPGVRFGWAFSQRVLVKIYNYRNAQGEYLYREEMNQGRLFGYPFAATTQIPNNLGAGTNETEVYLGDWNELIMGETDRLSMTYSNEAAYFDGTNLVSAFSTDQTLTRAIARHDFGLRHTNGFVIATGNVLALT